jgi:hypothetical protein
MSRRTYEIGSSNVFADIGVPNAEEHLVKAQLVYKIDTLNERARTQAGRGRRPVRRQAARRVENAAGGFPAIFC